jgi:hypothetical protein
MAVERVLDIGPPNQHVAEAGAYHHDDPLGAIYLKHQPRELVRHQLSRSEMVSEWRLEVG